MRTRRTAAAMTAGAALGVALLAALAVSAGGCGNKGGSANADGSNARAQTSTKPAGPQTLRYPEFGGEFSSSKARGGGDEPKLSPDLRRIVRLNGDKARGDKPRGGG